jgi:hypothetical protein
MRRVTKWLALCAIGLSALLIAPPAALAKPTVQWTRVDVPERPDSARITKLLKKALTDAAKRANFGKAKAVALTARLIEFTAEERGDVLQIRCTIQGRVVGGASARSKISFGGSPTSRADLEKQVLTMVANGLVARLAQIARSQAKPPGTIR